MDLRSLRYVAAIAAHQNLTKAAESLYVGQPTLSKFLAGLERELGLRLFDRIGHRYVPTYAGSRYVEAAREILRLKAGLDDEMADILKREVGVLNVAFANMRGSYMLPEVLPRFRDLHPNVRLNVFEGSSSENDRRLLSGEIDVAFYSMPSAPNPRIAYHPLASEELLICKRAGHPLGRYARSDPDSAWPRLELSRLRDELVLMMMPEQRTRQIVDAILEENGLRFENVLYTPNIPAIMGLVANGYGVSFVFDAHLKHRAGTAPIDCYSFGRPRTVCHFVAATRQGSYLSSHAQVFIDTVKALA